MNDGDLAAASFFTACEDLHVSVNWGAVGYFIVKYLRDTRSVVQGILCHPAELYRDLNNPFSEAAIPARVELCLLGRSEQDASSLPVR